MTSLEINQVKRKEIIDNFNQIMSNHPILMKKNNFNIEFVEDFYSTLSLKDMSLKYNLPIVTIQKRIKSLGLPSKKDLNYHRRNSSVNEEYFNIIDTEEKAYFLGFIYADGFVHQREHGGALGMSLNNRDKYMLEKFREILEITTPLQPQNEKDQHRLYISSDKLFKSLINLGCVPNKSLILNPPTEQQVPVHLQRHFIRGYFDGDGCICHTNRKKHSVKTVSFAGTKQMLTFIQKHIRDILENEKGNIKTHQNIFVLSFHTKSDIVKIYNYLYSGSNLFLHRKHDKFLL